MVKQYETATPAATGEEEVPVPAWKERAQSELKDLRGRIYRLEEFIGEQGVIDTATLNFLKTQLSAMLAYEVALSNRIEK